MPSRSAPLGAGRPTRPILALFCLVAVAACTAPTSNSSLNADAALASVAVSPDSFYVVQGDTFDVLATGATVDGQRVTPTVAWSASGGSITAAGRYIAGLDTGVYAVTAATANGLHASAVVFLGSNITAILVTPETVTLSPGQTQQFTARGVTLKNDTIPVRVIWSATGGTITQAGLFTAADVGGPISVVAELAPPEVNGVPVITPSRRRVVSGGANVRLRF